MYSMYFAFISLSAVKYGITTYFAIRGLLLILYHQKCEMNVKGCKDTKKQEEHFLLNGVNLRSI